MKNTEDLYIGHERLEENGERAVGEMVITRRASERITRIAFEQAVTRGFHKVTVVHKANVPTRDHRPFSADRSGCGHRIPANRMY